MLIERGRKFWQHLKKSLIDDNYQRAQDIVSLPNGVKYGYRSFRRDFTPEEQEKILRRVSQVGIKRAADEYGASINVVKGWMKEFERAVAKEEPEEEPAVKKPGTPEKKMADDFSENEKAAILARAKETSISQAARDFNTTRWVIRRLIAKSEANKPAKPVDEKLSFFEPMPKMFYRI